MSDGESLLSAVESGDVLAMLREQRRIIATALMSAADNTRPQFNNELNKLHALIRAEEERVEAERLAAEDAADSSSTDSTFDASAI